MFKSGICIYIFCLYLDTLFILHCSNGIIGLIQSSQEIQHLWFFGYSTNNKNSLFVSFYLPRRFNEHPLFICCLFYLGGRFNQHLLFVCFICMGDSTDTYYLLYLFFFYLPNQHSLFVCFICVRDSIGTCYLLYFICLGDSTNTNICFLGRFYNICNLSITQILNLSFVFNKLFQLLKCYSNMLTPSACRMQKLGS